MGGIKKFIMILGLVLSLSIVAFSQEKSVTSDKVYDIDFQVGLGYLLSNEFSSVLYYGNYTNYYSLLHGFSINSTVSVFSNEDDKVGFIGGFGIGVPNSLFSWFNKTRKENFNLTNSYFTGVMLHGMAGVQFRHFFNYYNRIDSSICGKIGYYYTTFRYGEDYSESSSNYNVTFGISTKINYTHLFNNKYGIATGMYLSYDFISLAEMVDLNAYKGYGVIDVMPFVSAVIKF